MSEEQRESNGSSRGAAILGMVVTFLGGYVLGSMSAGGGDPAKDPAHTTRKAVPVGQSPAKGSEDAMVTIIEFADFECGYCRRSVPIQRRLFKQYEGRVRWVFKHLPLGFHRRAQPAAVASMAANAQGKFWEYHDRLFLQQSKLNDADLVEHARALDLDIQRFKKDLAEKKYDSVVQADADLAKQFKVQGTPNFFINGRHIMGSLSYARIEEIVREEIAYTRGLMAKGVKRADLYQELTKDGDVGKKDEPKQPADTKQPTSALNRPPRVATR